MKCRVLGCETEGSSGFHAFPKNENVCDQWIMLTKSFRWESKIKSKSNSYYRVCKKHFKESDFVNGRRIPNTLPSQFLPGSMIPPLRKKLEKKSPREDQNNVKNDSFINCSIYLTNWVFRRLQVTTLKAFFWMVMESTRLMSQWPIVTTRQG